MLGKIPNTLYTFMIGSLISVLIFIFMMFFIIYYRLDKFDFYKVDKTVLIASKDKKLMDKTYNKLIHLFDLNKKYDLRDLDCIYKSTPIDKKINLDWYQLFDSPLPSSYLDLKVCMIFFKKYTNEKIIENKVTLKTIDKIKICKYNYCYLFDINNEANDTIDITPYQLSLTWRDEIVVKIKQ